MSQSLFNPKLALSPNISDLTEFHIVYIFYMNKGINKIKIKIIKKAI